ncbi:hypothetical protein M3Y99_00330700 [Aphelenchoides fujianensis]|nr:hypothetical protein M3Y99_00330700 [Aphelenchoides fujianensis]
MADNQSIDLMASIFGNISLPQVHASTDHLHRDEELDDQRSRTSSVPVPKQRQEHAYLPHEDYEYPLLRKDSEFQSQVIPLEAVTVTYDRASRHSFGGSTFDDLPQRRQSSVIYDEIPYEHEHELHDQVHDVQSVHSHHTLNDRHSLIEEHSLHSEHSEVLPVDHIEPLHYEPEPELPPIDEDTARANRVIAELKERHFINDNFDGNTITTSKTSELANEYDLYSTPVPDAQPTDVNEQTDDSGTETEEVQPANRTQYLFDSQEPYHVVHDKAPDSFQRELGQRVSQYGERQESVEAPPRPAHAQKMESKRNSNASDFVVTTFDQPHHERIRSDISAADVNIHDLRHKFEHPHVHHQKSDSEHPSIRSNRSSYKHRLAPSIRRSESIASTLTLGTENFSRDAYPSYRFAQHNAVSYEPPPVIHEQPQSPKPVMPAPKTYLKYVHPPKPVLQHQHSQDGQHVHHRPSIVHEPAPTHELSRQTSRRSSHHHAAPSHVHEHVYEHVHEPVVHHEHHKKTVNSIQRNGLEYQAPKVNGNHAFLANERKSWAILEKYRHANEEHADENSNVHSVHHEEVHVPHEHHHVEHEVIHVHHNEHLRHPSTTSEHHEHHEEHSVHHHEEDHYSEIHDTHSDRDVTPTPPKGGRTTHSDRLVAQHLRERSPPSFEAQSSSVLRFSALKQFAQPPGVGARARGMFRL